MTRDELKQRIYQAIDQRADEIIGLGEAIRRHPELGFKEFKTARLVEETDDEGGDLESIHAGVDRGQEDDPGEQLSGNVLDRVTRERGDIAAAFAASDAVVEGTFRTPWVYQAYIEPQVCTAWTEPSGTLVVSTSTQGSPFRSACRAW